MGLEAECTVRVGRKSSTGTARLEGEALFFRGDFRLDVPLERIREVAVVGEALVVRTEKQEARFELGGPVATRWLRMIREPKGLLEKLEVGPTSRIAVVGVQDMPFLSAVREHAASVVEGRVPAGAATIFFGAETREALDKIPLLRARMAEAGALWVVRPKASKAISESDVLGTIRGAGLVDTKVVAFSKTHTAHKCVIPLELRGKAVPRAAIVSLRPGPADLAKNAGADENAGVLEKPAKAKTPRKTGEPAKK
jgi:hypothetical protein